MKLALAASAVAAVAVSGTGLRQVQCIAPQEHGCSRAVAVSQPTGVDAFGASVYVRNGVGSFGSLGVFARDPRSGRLRQLQCVARHARPCAEGRGLETPAALAVSPDGHSVYVAAANGRSLGIYARGGDGRLGSRGFVTGLPHARAVAVSADGRNVYVGGDRLWSFSRDPSGALTPTGSFETPISALAIAPGDPGTLYAVAGGGAHGAVRRWSREPAAGDLSDPAELDAPATPAIQQPAAVVAVRGGLYVAATVSGAVSYFDRDLRHQRIARGLPLASGLAVTGDRVYVAYRDGVAVLTRDLRRLGTARLAHATGVAAAGRSVYAVSRGRLTAFSAG